MTMEIISTQTTSQPAIIAKATAVLAAGGLVIFPTETTYGIGADATDPKAIAKLLQYKSRREGKPLSIAVSGPAMAADYVHLNPQAEQLMSQFLPGPITVVCQSKGKVAPGVASERGTLGIRWPDYLLVTALVEAFGRPITASSANASYKKRPYSIADILSNLSKQQQNLIDLIIDAGQLPPNEPSTVVDTTLEQPTVLRQGEIKLTDATIVTTNSSAATQALGRQLVNLYRNYLSEKSLIFALIGEMGAGKTQLSKGIAEALGIDQPVTSPTYTLAKEYRFSYGDTINQFIHIDTWRLFSDQEFLELGFKEMVDRNSIISIEWADKIQSLLKEYSSEAKIIWVRLAYGETNDQRIINYSDQEPA